MSTSNFIAAQNQEYVRTTSNSTLTIIAGFPNVILTNDPSMDGQINSYDVQSGVLYVYIPEQDTSLTAVNVYCYQLNIVDESLAVTGIDLNIYAWNVTLTSTSSTFTFKGPSQSAQPAIPQASPGGVGTTGSDGDKSNTDGGDGGTGGVGKNGNDGQDGDSGAAGPNITINANTINSVNSGKLTITSTGSPGQDGQPGQQGGNGGPGGDGGTGDKGTEASGGNGGNGGSGGNGGDGGKGSDGGNGGAIAINTVQSITASWFILTSSGGAKGNNAAGGAGGSGGAGGQGGAGAQSSPPYPPGLPGNPGQPGPSGNPGSIGSGTPSDGTAGNTTTNSITMQNFAETAQYEQLALLFQIADLQYLTLAAVTPSDLYDFILDVSIMVKTIYNALPSEQQTSLMNALYQRACQTTLQLSNGQDYFGNAPNYVTLIAYDELNNAVTETITALQDIESDYNTINNRLSKSSEVQAAISEQIKAHEGQIQDNLTQLATDVADVSAIAPEISTLNDTMVAKQQTLASDYATVIQDITNYVNCSGTASFFTSIAMVAFAPETTIGNVGKISSVIGGLLNTANQLGQINLGGLTVSKQYLLQQLIYQGDQLSDLQEGYQTAVETGLINTDDSINPVQLLALESDFDNLVTQYLQSNTDAQQAETAFNDYVQAVQNRNAAITSYNNDMMNYIQLYMKNKSLESEITELNNELNNDNNAGLALSAVFINNLHGLVRNNCIYQLYLLNKAFNFWALDNSIDVLSMLSGVNSLGNVSSTDLQTAQSQLIQDMQTVLNECYFPNSHSTIQHFSAKYGS